MSIMCADQPSRDMSTTGQPPPRGMLLFDLLVGSPEFAEFALILKQLTGLIMALNTPDVVTSCHGLPEDTGNPLCRLIRGTVEGLKRCTACDRREHARAASTGTAKLYTCHAGFFDMAIPIIVQGEHVATVSSGQVLPKRPSDAEFDRWYQRVRWLSLPKQRLREAYNAAPWIPQERLAHIMRLLEIFAQHLCESKLRIWQLETCLKRPDIRRAKALVDQRYREPALCLSAIAAEVGLSLAYLSHLFHQETGVTFTHYMHTLRIEEAKRLLTDTEMSITAVCFACGFNSLTHFNRVFRAGTSVSPRQFRRINAAE